jgi:hypothetical protein
MADDYRKQQDRIFQDMADREAESVRREKLVELKSILTTRGADRKLIDQTLKAMRALANLRHSTDTERQADYDSQVGEFLEELLSRR